MNNLNLKCWMNILYKYDKETYFHSLRVKKYVKIIINNLQKQGIYKEALSTKFINDTIKYSILHDIGKIFISKDILNKPEKLTKKEFDYIKLHTIFGCIISNDKNKILIEIIKYHHENWDGSGYPNNLSNFNIPLSARIVSIADVYDALLSSRPYKLKYSEDRSYKLLLNMKYKFDPNIFNMFINICLNKNKMN